MWNTARTAAVAAAALGVLAAPAGAAWADKNAQETIDDLQNQGYSVTIDRVGSKPLSECSVTAVRNPQSISQWLDLDDNAPFNGPVPVVLRQSITVSLNCS
ncbi:MAG: hypothetical protein HYZ38_26465 [Mycobacterium sp.]|nr:hypothetical protein [Mycobacterium sp.]